MFEMLSLFPLTDLLVAVIAIVIAYVIAFAVAFGTLVFLTRRRRPRIRLFFYPLGLRVRLWQFMAAILVFGLSLHLVILAAASFRACRKAEAHTSSASSFRWIADYVLLGTSGNPAAGRSDSWVDEHFRELVLYHQRMSEKYYDAARHPWRHVPPDPPAPTLEEAARRALSVVPLEAQAVHQY
jgi:hypothetical protein